MTKVFLHGEIAEIVGRKEWSLAVSSISEALHAIQILSKGKLYNYFIESAKNNVEYKILVNGREMLQNEEIKIENPQTVINSELVMINKNLKTLDLIPLIVGAGGSGGNNQTKGIIALVLAAVLIATGVGAPAGSLLAGSVGTSLAIGGVALAIAGITLLTMQPPKFEDFRTISDGKSSSKPSYLFDGPTNIVGEGGPVPIGYGRMRIGSQTIEISITNKELPNTSTAEDIKNSVNLV